MNEISKSENRHDDLNDFVDGLREEGDLLEINEEISPRFEVSAIMKAIDANGTPAVLFPRVAGYPGKAIVGNILGHRRRLAKVMGVAERDVIDAFIKRKKNRISPKIVTDAPVKQVECKGVDLFGTLPALIHHEKDTSPYLTCAVTFAKDPETGGQSMGVHRIQIRSKNELAICLVTPPLTTFLSKARKLEKPLEVAVVIGPHPSVLIAAVTWCPDGEDKIGIAGAIRDKAIQMVHCETVDVSIPSRSQFVIEGIIEPNHFGTEGVFGESSGTYVAGVESPIITVRNVSHRERPLYQALVPWSSEDDALFNLCFGSDILDVAKSDFPFIQDLFVCPGTVSAHIIISVRDASPSEIRCAMEAILKRNPFAKMVTFVNEDIDIRNWREVQWAVSTRFQGDKDLYRISGLEGSEIDPSRLPDGTSTKIGLDATCPKEREEVFGKVAISDSIRGKAREVLDRIGVNA